jgi:probable O-glycosylation ligase (exosortase A-associated)
VRDLVALAFFVPYVALAFINPFAGYLLWGWAGLVALNYYLFGFMQSFQYVQIFAIITLTALVLNRNKETFRFQGNSTSSWMMLFVAHALICATLAYPGLVRNWELWGNVAKTVLFCLLMPVLATSRFRIHALVVMIVIGTSFHGVLDGLKYLNSAGSHKAQVIAKFGDNNHLAMVLLMIVPLLYYLYLYSNRIWVRYGFLLTILLMVLAVVSTNSRGGLIGLFALAVWLVYRSRRRFVGTILVCLAALLVTQLASDSWVQRMDTIQDAQEDDSFQGRLQAWRVSAAIAQEHPFFGGGLRAIQAPDVWIKFRDAPSLLAHIEMPPNAGIARAAHSIWFEVLGDQGFLGLLIFVGLVANTFMVARQVRKLAKANGPSERWASDLGNLLTVSMVTFAVTGSALSAAYFELPYVCMILIETVRQQQLRVAANRLKAI